jgi:hypothetical protein
MVPPARRGLRSGVADHHQHHRDGDEHHENDVDQAHGGNPAQTPSGGHAGCCCADTIVSFMVRPAVPRTVDVTGASSPHR